MSKTISTSATTPTLSELEHRTELLRSRIDETLEELSHQLTPANLGRAAAAKAGAKIVHGTASLASSTKRHPRAALAVGIGLFGAWCLRRAMRK